MRRKSCISLLLVGCGLLTLLLALLLGHGNDGPSYQGKTLTHWLEIYASSEDTDPEVQQAAEAVRQIGTNALPFLIASLSYETTPTWKTNLLRPIPRSLHIRYRAILWRLVYWDQKEAAADRAQSGFEILGQQAEPAIPALTNLLPRCKYWVTRSRVITALAHIGTNGLQIVVGAMTNKSNPDSLRFIALDRIENLGTNAACAIPALVGELDDPMLGPQVTVSLGKLKSQPELVTPALARCLHSQELLLPESAAEALEEFGTQAVAAVPDLVWATTNHEKHLRIAATNALLSIAPQVLLQTAH